MPNEVRLSPQDDVEVVLGRAPAGSCVIISSGDYRHGIRVVKPLTLLGDGFGGEVAVGNGGIDIATEVTLRGLHLVGHDGSSTVNVRRSGSIRLEECEIDSFFSNACCLSISGGHSDIRNCVFKRGKTGIRIEKGAADALVQDCTFLEQDSHGIVIRSSNVRIMDCRITGVTGGEYGASIYIEDCCPEIRQCDVRDGICVGISVHGNAARPSIARCTIRGSDGISFIGKSSGTVEDCTFEGRGSWGVYIGNGCHARIARCQISDYVIGIQEPTISAGNFIQSANTIIEGCSITRSSAIGISIVNTAPVIVGCTITDNYRGIGIEGSGTPTIDGCRIDANEDGNVSRRNKDKGRWEEI
jgi:parallel beta-helix repeat protein